MFTDWLINLEGWSQTEGYLKQKKTALDYTFIQ